MLEYPVYSHVFCCIFIGAGKGKLPKRRTADEPVPREKDDESLVTITGVEIRSRAQLLRKFCSL